VAITRFRAVQTEPSLVSTLNLGNAYFAAPAGYNHPKSRGKPTLWLLLGIIISLCRRWRSSRGDGVHSDDVGVCRTGARNAAT